MARGLKTGGAVYAAGGFFKGTRANPGSEITGTGGSTGTWDSIYDTDQAMTVDGTTFSITGTHPTNNVLTLGGTETTGDLIQFSNSGTGKDIDGTSSSWSVSKLGAIDGLSLTADTVVVGDGASTGVLASSGNYDVTLQTGNATTSKITITDGAAGNITFAMDSTGGVVISGTTEGSASLTVTNGDAVVSDGSLTITDDDNANSLALTNATISSGTLIGVTAAALDTGIGLLMTANGLTSGKMISLVTTATGLTTGSYIYVDDGSERFSVKADGATKITSGVNSTVALSVAGIQTSENMVLFASNAVTASGYGVLKVTNAGAGAAGSAVLLVTSTGTPAAATSYLAHFDYTPATEATNNPITVQISSGLSVGAALNITSTATTITGGILNITNTEMTTGVGINIVSLDALTTGSAIVVASNSADATARNIVSITNTNVAAVGAVPLRVTQSATGATTAAVSVTSAGTGDNVLITNTGTLGAAKSALHIVSNVTTMNATSALAYIHQDHTAGVAFCMTLVQDDLDVPFINFVGTATADSNSNISTHGTGTVTDFVRCSINGTAAWIPVVTGALSA